MKTTDQWLNEITSQILHLEARGIKVYYGFSLEMSKETVRELKQYFVTNGYDIRIETCPLDKKDVIICWQ